MVAKVVQCLSKNNSCLAIVEQSAEFGFSSGRHHDFVIVELVWNTPFKSIGLLLFGIHLMKKCPHALLKVLVSEK
jgi:hypothetical protein